MSGFLPKTEYKNLKHVVSLLSDEEVEQRKAQLSNLILKNVNSMDWEFYKLILQRFLEQDKLMNRKSFSAGRIVMEEARVLENLGKIIDNI